MNNETNVAEYATPEIVDHGSLSDLTAGNTFGSYYDKTYPKGTPASVVPTLSGP